MDRAEVKQWARAAHARAAYWERQVLARVPDAWTCLDEKRRDGRREVDWPDWCLLPMAAPAALVQERFLPPNWVAVLAALYAWQHSRSVWLVKPTLSTRLLEQVPDAIGIDDLATLPEWCIYLPTELPEHGGLWIHLEYDVATGRPELRLLLDTGGSTVEGLLPVTVYLDRPTLTEALADWRATTGALIAAGLRPGLDIHGGELDAGVARLADHLDGYVSIARYLARPEADIVCLDRPGLTPKRPRRRVRDRQAWWVGSRVT